MLHPSLMVGQVGSPIPNGPFHNFQTNGTFWELPCERVAGNLSNGIHAGPCVAEGLATRSTPATWGSKRLLAAFLQTLLAYPDGRTRGETIFDPATGVPIVQAPSAVGRQDLPERAGVGGPSGGGAARREKGPRLRHPYRDATHHRADGGRADPPRDAGHSARLNLRTKVLDFVHAGCPAWIRTRVNRSKVCCATTAPRGKGERNAILAGLTGAGQRRAGPARRR